MRFRRFMERWQGIFLCLIGSVAALWLGATHQLNLYIHPRYIVFTVVLSLIAVVLATLSFIGPRDHDAPKQRTAASLGVACLCAAAVVGLLVAKPTILTTATATQRGINSGVNIGMKTTDAVPLFGGGDYESFTVKDWASLLGQTSEISFYQGKSADIVGFVAPDPDDAQNTFFVSRFVISCCAVDARPIGVPVYMPGWRSQYKPDDWVHVKGGFISNPSTQSGQRIVVKPEAILAVPQPKEPYVY